MLLKVWTMETQPDLVSYLERKTHSVFMVWVDHSPIERMDIHGTPGGTTDNI